ncbi:MAG: sigma-70 family RNA polymerase sigma factor [Candidatus Pacebacteria bacterium]|nr:sigma-70 family RNA polymerase sigma factor [Candidatus Paceibacterota bacterium]
MADKIGHSFTINMASPENKKFAKIYDKHIDKIYRFIFLKTGVKEVAEDITSQVFTKGWRKFKLQGCEVKNMSAYLFQIARAEVANHYREKNKFQIISAQAVEIIDDQPNPETTQEIVVNTQDAQSALRELEDGLQDILIWHYVEGMSFKEIGGLLSRPEGTVRVMAHRALKELREKMEE